MRSFFLLVVFAPTLAFAQADTTWSVEVKAGPQYVRLNDPIGPFNGPYTGRSVKGIGYLAGVSIGAPVRQGLGLRAELLYSVRNTSYAYDERTDRHVHPADTVLLEWGERRTHIDALELPLLVAWSGWPGIRLETGPAVAWLLRTREHAMGERSAGKDVQPFDDVLDRTKAMVPLEWAAVLGFEVEGPNGLSLSFRYWQGFTDLDGGRGASPSQGAAWQFALVYAVKAGRSGN